jgi:hypothetical protein
VEELEEETFELARENAELRKKTTRLSRERDESVGARRKAVEKARRNAGMSAAGKGSLVGLALGALVFAVAGNAGALIGLQLLGAIFGGISGYAAPVSSRTIKSNSAAAAKYGHH